MQIEMGDWSFRTFSSSNFDWKVNMFLACVTWALHFFPVLHRQLPVPSTQHKYCTYKHRRIQNSLTLSVPLPLPSLLCTKTHMHTRFSAICMHWYERITQARKGKAELDYSGSLWHEKPTDKFLSPTTEVRIGLSNNPSYTHTFTGMKQETSWMMKIYFKIWHLKQGFDTTNGNIFAQISNVNVKSVTWKQNKHKGTSESSEGLGVRAVTKHWLTTRKKKLCSYCTTYMWADSLFIWLIWDWIMSTVFNWIRSSLYLTFHDELLLFSFIRDDCVCSGRGEFSCSLSSIQSWPISLLSMVAMLMSCCSFVDCDFFIIVDSLLIIQLVHEKERHLTVSEMWVESPKHPDSRASETILSQLSFSLSPNLIWIWKNPNMIWFNEPI